ncbi:hypothetical protein KCP73_06265 [Salmonella enterica subsp. enterica]|nr:hypothetical protein KCP73_06265 [Salmonella enterica subsp. enterica]
MNAAPPFIPGFALMMFPSGKWSDGKSGYRRQQGFTLVLLHGHPQNHTSAESRTDIGAKSYSHFAGFAWLWRQRDKPTSDPAHRTLLKAHGVISSSC